MDKPVERQKFYTAILEMYNDGKELTARECAEHLKKQGLCKFGIRQETQPRLVEMCKMGWMQTVGSKFDQITKKTVTIYAIKEN